MLSFGSIYMKKPSRFVVFIGFQSSSIMLYVNPSYLNISYIFKLLCHLLNYVSIGEKTSITTVRLCINNDFHTAKPEKILVLCFFWYSHHKDRFPQGFDLPSSYLIQSLKTLFSGVKGAPKCTYNCKYLPKWLNREGRSPFNCHNVREQGTTAAAEEMLPA